MGGGVAPTTDMKDPWQWSGLGGMGGGDGDACVRGGRVARGYLCLRVALGCVGYYSYS